MGLKRLVWLLSLGMSASTLAAQGQAPAAGGDDPAVRGAEALYGPKVREWAQAATLVVVARYRRGTYPCLPGPDGSTRVPLAQTLDVERVVRGTLARQDVDFGTPRDPSPRFPSSFAADRRYLAFLRPTDEASARLRDPDFQFGVHTALGPEDFVAILDLDATPEEVAAQARAVSESEDRLAFEFTPEAWRELRASRTENLELIARFQTAIGRREIKATLRREDVHQRFGPPDRTEKREGNVVDAYDFQPLLRAGAPDGTLIGKFEIEYGKTGRIREYREDFDVVEGGELRPATYDEKRARGMSWSTIRMPYVD